MKIRLLLEVDAPDVARNADEVLADFRQLLLDCLQGAQRNPNFRLNTELTEADGPVPIMFTKADLAQRLQTSLRTIERYVKDGKLPEPVRIAAPHCTNGAPRWFAEDIPARV